MSTAKKLFVALPIATIAFADAWAADPVHFIKRSWDEVRMKVVETDTSVTDYFTLDGSIKKDYTLDRDVFYVVKKSFGREQIFVPENAVVNLVVCDGAKLEGMMEVKEGASLNIFAQSDGDGMGKIVAHGVGLLSGIRVPETASLVIHGGDIDERNAPIDWKRTSGQEKLTKGEAHVHLIFFSRQNQASGRSSEGRGNFHSPQERNRMARSGQEHRPQSPNGKRPDLLRTGKAPHAEAHGTDERASAAQSPLRQVQRQ